MFLIRVAPISKGIAKEELSYFSRESFSPGTIIRVPMRSREIPALVLLSENARDMRSEIRNADFALKKISKDSSRMLFSEPFIRAIQNTALSIGASTGALLNTLTPKKIIENEDVISSNEKIKISKGKHSTLILQAEKSERITQYKNIVRESFAKKQSVFICCPSLVSVKKVTKAISKGLESYIYELHSGMSKKAVLSTWSDALSNPHPIVIVGTPQFLSIPRPDIGTYILEEESSNSYKSIARPYVDIRLFIENLAREADSRLILADLVLRIETLFRYTNKKIDHLYTPKFKYSSGPKFRIVDMSSYKTITGNKKFRILSDEVHFIVENKVKENKENLFLFVGRKGLYPFTLCGDCGEYVICKKCGKPTTVQQYKDSRLFVCNACGKTRPTEERCMSCSSWKLQAMGVGVELVYEEIKAKYPDVPVFLIDKVSAGTFKKAEKVMNEFNAKDGAILVGTTLALPHIEEVDSSAVISIDALFAVPDFRMSERIFNLILDIRSKTKERMAVQIRNADTEIVEYVKSGNVRDFYKSEISLRKTFLYPPFARFIKITIVAPYNKIELEVKKVKLLFKDINMELFPAIYTKSASKRAINILLRIKDGAEEKIVLKNIQKLPPSMSVDVDPTMLL